VLWVHGSADVVVSDSSYFDMGFLGSVGQVPGWPGAEAFPPQPMVTQIRTVLERYRDAGGDVRMETFEGSGHFPPIDAAERFAAEFFGFVDAAG
jgi:pimeloyl-ACP methyl ester carboxylesterase